MLRFHPTSPAIPAAVMGLHDTGLLRVDMTSVGGDIDEYELTVADALRLSQRLRDAATAMQEFLSVHTREAPTHVGLAAGPAAGLHGRSGMSARENLARHLGEASKLAVEQDAPDYWAFIARELVEVGWRPPAADVSCEDEDALAAVIDGATNGTLHIRFDITGDRAWFADRMPRDLADATLAAGWRPPTVPDPVPRPDLSRLAEMDGYLDELARETGDTGPREFWAEIRRSINAPLRAWLEAQGKGGAA